MSNLHLSHGVGLGREERTKVGERSETGEGVAASTTLTRVAALPDLSRKRES
jgi:hypothetical protein